MLVMKFGGTSVGTPAAVRRVCALVKDRLHRDPVVVVSALGKTTDLLECAARVDGARAASLLASLEASTADTLRGVLGTVAGPAVQHARGVLAEAADLQSRHAGESDRNAPSALLDDLLGCGERISSRFIADALQAHSVPAVHLDSRELFVTERRHGGAAPLFGPTRDRLRPAVIREVRRGLVPVLGGFIARAEDGTPTTLGRGGSDLTASVAGAAAGAEEVQIWTDVDGVMTADPSLVESAQSLPLLSLQEAAELAYFGGRVLHPSTMLPAIEHGVPIRVLNSMRPSSRGTLIVRNVPPDLGVVKSVVYKENITLIDIHSTRMLMAHGFLARIFSIFDRHRTPVDMVSTSEVSVSLTVDSADRLPAIVDELSNIASVEAKPGKAIVCVVGDGIRYTLGIAARVFRALDGIRIRMISLGASRVNVGFVVDEEDLAPAVRRVHGEFFPDKSGGQT